MHDDAAQRWERVEQVARRLRCHPRTVRRMCARGEVVAELLPSGSQWRLRVRPDGFPVRA